MHAIHFQNRSFLNVNNMSHDHQIFNLEIFFLKSLQSQKLFDNQSKTLHYIVRHKLGNQTNCSQRE